MLLLILWLVGTSGLSQLDARLRRDSLIWPLVTGGLALVVVVVLAVCDVERQGISGSRAPQLPAPVAAPRGDTSNEESIGRLRRPTAGQSPGCSSCCSRRRFSWPRVLSCGRRARTAPDRPPQ